MREEQKKPASASPLPTPVLIADESSHVLHSLAALLRAGIPGIGLSICHSHSYAMHSLTVGRFQVVVCGAHFAVAHAHLLIKQHRAFQSFAPFILMAAASEWELAKSLLEQEGIEDIVTRPFNKDQLENSLREAMSLYQMRVTLAHRRQTLNTLRSWQAFPTFEKPGTMHEHVPLQAQRIHQRTIRRMETNLHHLAEMLNESERQARARAVEHLDLLGRQR